jgi:hypothetical protein
MIPNSVVVSTSRHKALQFFAVSGVNFGGVFVNFCVRHLVKSRTQTGLPPPLALRSRRKKAPGEVAWFAGLIKRPQIWGHPP